MNLNRQSRVNRGSVAGACTLLLGFLFMAFQVYAEELQVLNTHKDKVSYAVGFDLGRNYKKDKVHLEVYSFGLGFKDALSGNNLLMSEEDLRAKMNAFRRIQPSKKQGIPYNEQVKWIPAPVSYAMGVEGARTFKALGIDLDGDLLARGLDDVFSGRESLMNNLELRRTLGEFQVN